MPQSNDGSLTRLVTSQHKGSVEDPAPNTALNNSETSFDLHLEGVAGNTLGNGGNSYTLTITAFDQTAGQAAPATMNPGSLAQNFTTAGGLWAASANGAEFVTDQTFTIPVPGGGVASGHVFVYTASLISTNRDQAWLIESDPFVLS
jgi:hypothetical protein